MIFLSNTEYDLSTFFSINGFYKAVGYHRNGNPNKSQWLISVDEEINCFVVTIENRWISDDHRGWGISADCKVLGKTTSKNDTYIARFEEDRYALNHWHGYPADLSRNQDIPLGFILIDWKQQNYITKSQYSKIRRGIL